MVKYYLIAAFLFFGTVFASSGKTKYQSNQVIKTTQVLVVGGGTGGVAAGIQSARSGAKTIIVEQTSWLGGMLTSAGVSATDGNNDLPSGFWGEFRQALYKYYGGPEVVATGWVSNTCFEPHVADSIFKAIASKEKNLLVIYNYRFVHVLKKAGRVTGAVFINKDKKELTVNADVVIDATELGDVFKDAGAGYDVGMESKAYSGESSALDTSNNIIQDITYTAILKDYGPGANKTIVKPASYDSAIFICSCKNSKCQDAAWTPKQMLDYGKLPNNKYMINWPDHGNDYYLNAIEMNYEQRQKAYQAAKDKTLCFVYFIQHELGYRNLGLADDEFPTKDKLPFIPYNREGRRVHGIVRFTVNYILHPYTQKEKLYRTDIAVSDYPIDQHITENPEAPKRNFPKVPSFGVPLGCLIPKGVDGLIVAEKGISVSNVVNGATRLTTCVLLIGQAAGVLAAYSVENHIEPKDANVRAIQRMLLNCNAYLLPFIDVKPGDPNFKAIQRIGATGIMKGEGVPFDWANQTWFYPGRQISQYELVQGLRSYYPLFDSYNKATGETLDVKSFLKILSIAGKKISITILKLDWANFKFNKTLSESLILDRRMAAVLVDYYLHPFDRPVDLFGNFK